MKPELPSRDAWRVDFDPHRPSAYPPSLPDRAEAEQTLLVGPKGEPLLVRRPAPFGFRPPEER